MQEEEYEVEEGDSDQYYYVSKKRSGVTSTVLVSHSVNPDHTNITVEYNELSASTEPPDEDGKIEEAVRNYMEQKEKQEIDVNALEHIYEKYKHMDEPLSDTERIDENDVRTAVLYDLWTSIKATLKKDSEICNECGRSVRVNGGNFVNRVPDYNTVEERKEMGKPFPIGDFICAECDNK